MSKCGRYLRFLLTLIPVAAIPAAPPVAFAAPMTYTLTGYLQATSSLGNVNAAFTWTVAADTSGITYTPPGIFQVPAISSTITINGVVSNFGLANVTVYANAQTGSVTFGNLQSGGIGLNSISLDTWSLATAVGPFTGPNVLTPGTLTGTNGLVITLTGVANSNNGPSPTFQAAFPVPTITNVQNAAGEISAGLPNAGIAQGSIFILVGSDLGPATIAISPTPFQSTAFSGTSIAVTVGGTTVNPLMYYTSATQVAALLPSNTPVGTGTVTVTYNGTVGSSSPVTVVQNNLGIFTVDSSGQGPGIVTFADYSLVSPAKAANCGGPYTTCGAANPNDTLILWGTGLGPVNGSDAAGAGLGQDMPNIPLKLWLGGVEAPVTYRGRSGCCLGEDQIVFTVPSNVPTGCAIPLLVQIGNEISNNTVMAVANGSRSCTYINPALSSINTEKLVTSGPVSIGDIDLEKDYNSSDTGYQDEAHFQFLKAASYNQVALPFFASFADQQPVDTCIVFNNLKPGENLPVTDYVSLDGGPSVTLRGPNGNVTLTGASGELSTISAAGTFLVPGSYSVTGLGGADVGPFNATITIPALPKLVSPLPSTTVTRSSGVTFTWTGGSGNVLIWIDSATDNTKTNGATAECTAPASAQTFTVPSYVLEALPAGNIVGYFLGTAETDVPFSATGLMVGNLHAQSVGQGGGLTLK